MINETRSRCEMAGGFEVVPQKLRGPLNTLIHAKEPLAPELENVQSPNDHTLYTTAWLDLRDGPLVLHVLDMAGRFSTCQLVDAYTNNFSYVSQRTRGFREMDIAIGGPGRSRPVWNVITIVRSSRNDGRQPVLYT